MSNPPFIPATLPVPPVASERRAASDTSSTQHRLEQRSALEAARAALVDVDGSRASELLELEGLIRFSSARRAKQRGGSEEAIEYASTQLKQLTERLGKVDQATLKTLMAHFPGLGTETDPLARLMAAQLAPGPAALLLAAAQAGADKARRRRLQDALARLLKQMHGEIHFGLFAFLTIGSDPQQCEAMKQLYRHMVDESGTMSALFKSLKQLPDREIRLQTLLCAVACELSGADSAVRGVRLAAVVNDVRRLLIFLSLDETCRNTAARLAQSDGMGGSAAAVLEGDTVLTELIDTSEQAWVDATYLDLRLGALGIVDLSAKLRCARAFQEIWNYLPAPFFDADQEKRQQILTAFKEWTITLAEQEEELF